jgi:hypothetical protein
MMHGLTSPSTRQRGYTTVELLIVLVLSAIVMGGMVVTYGTLTRSQPRVASVVDVPLGAACILNFYGEVKTVRPACVAPHYGSLARAEKLREEFNNDVISATAIFCLPREGLNTWRPVTIPYDPTVHGDLDTPQKFRTHIIAAASIDPALYRDYRNPLNTVTTAPSPNASIFLLGYSDVEKELRVNAIYDIDVIRFIDPSQPKGYHASVKRYSQHRMLGTAHPLVFSGGYDVFFPPSIPAPGIDAAQWSADGFTPLFVTFERATRRAIVESPATINRFKVAAERPFYFVWWPDPGARHLGPQSSALSSTDPRQAYNHMAGRTAFMFTVPMFPAL